MGIVATIAAIAALVHGAANSYMIVEVNSTAEEEK